jgi:hypothetical protein
MYPGLFPATINLINQHITNILFDSERFAMNHYAQNGTRKLGLKYLRTNSMYFHFIVHSL